MERLPNGTCKTLSKTAFQVQRKISHSPLLDKAYGCIAQLVEQLTLNQQFFQQNQSHIGKARDESAANSLCGSMGV